MARDATAAVEWAGKTSASTSSFSRAHTWLLLMCRHHLYTKVPQGPGISALRCIFLVKLVETMQKPASNNLLLSTATTHQVSLVVPLDTRKLLKPGDGIRRKSLNRLQKCAVRLELRSK